MAVYDLIWRYLTNTGYLVPLLISYSVCLAALIIGSVSDLRTREVPDWLNYGLVFSGVSLNAIYSAIYSDVSFLINSILGLAAFFVIACLMFYTGQWGGGDSKMLMGLGAMIGVGFSLKMSQLLPDFLINILLIGAAYGMLWSLFLAIKNKNKFLREFKKRLASRKVMRAKKIMLVGFLSGLAVISSAYFYLSYGKSSITERVAWMMGISLMFLGAVTFYLWVFVKSVESACMYKLMNPSQLTEGDWIAKDVLAGGKYICGPKDLGIEKKQIRKLISLHGKGKVGKILIKEGIPFVPSFLIAFVLTLIFGNFIVWII